MTTGRFQYILVADPSTVIGNEMRVKLQDLHMSDFHPLKGVGRGSETHLQVGKKKKNLT